jgi:hypothetical protein
VLLQAAISMAIRIPASIFRMFKLLFRQSGIAQPIY